MRIPPMPPRDDRPSGDRCEVTLRDTFAAAALTGLLYADVDELAFPYICGRAYRCADAMLAERAKTNLDAVPAARAEARVKQPNGNAAGEPGGDQTGKIGTGTLTEAEDNALEFVVITGRIASLDDRRTLELLFYRLRHGALNGCETVRCQPVAWAVMARDGFGIEGTFTDLDEAREWCDDRQQIVPLYAHPPKDRAVRLPKADEQHGGWLHTVESCVLERVQAALDAAGVKWEVERE